MVPLGISFYTFSAIGYILDVYKEKIEPCRRLSVYALYVSFFPKISQGPIENSTNLLLQLYEPKYSNYEQYLEGFTLILVGFFKKLMIADRLGIAVNTVYGNLENYNGINYFIAAIFYSFQIYYDFSGYTDIAR